MPGKRRQHRLALRFEWLEQRWLLSGDLVAGLRATAAGIAADEQLFVYLLNRARHDPVAYQLEQGLRVDLSYVTPRPPLALSEALSGSAGFHAEEMATHNYFGHQSAVTGDWPNKMARDFGYELPAWWEDDNNYIESIAGSPIFSDAITPLNALIVDEGVPSLGHRIHLLGIDEFTSQDREIGVGHGHNPAAYYEHYWAVHVTRSDPADRFLTGVAFADANQNGRYDLNEGVAGMTVSAGAISTTTNSAGGWSLQVDDGIYTLTASGGGFAGTAASTVIVQGDSMEVDFISGQPWGIVDFDETSIPPAAVDDWYTMTEGPPLVVPTAAGVLANDTPNGQDPLSAALVEGPAHGSLTLAADGSFTYSARSAFHGTDSFTYLARAGQAYSGITTVTLTVTRDLGTIEFRELAGLDPSAGDLWYRAAAIRGGFLTLETTPAGSPDAVALTLYDPSGNELAASQLVEGNQRIDWVAGPGEVYLFRVAASSDDVGLRLANLVSFDADEGRVEVFGTDGDDQLQAAAVGSFDVAINAVAYHFPTASVLQASGGLGSDTATFQGTSAEETATLSPGAATVIGLGFQAEITETETIALAGGEGHDTVTFYDSPQSDTFTAGPYQATMAAAGTTNSVTGFEIINAEAPGAGPDEARLSDSAGDETYVGAGSYGGLWGDDFQVHVLYFDNIQITASQGRDVAKFYDTEADDVFTGTPAAAAMEVAGTYRNEAVAFDRVDAYATAGSGYDTANLEGFGGDDVFYGHPIESALYSEGREFFNRAKLFEEVNATAGEGGYDLARMYDSVADDVFVTAPEYGELSGMRHDEFTMQLTDRPYKYKAMNFSGVHAYATHGGYDRASMFDSPVDDIYYAEPEHAAMYTLDASQLYFNRAKFFERVDAYANSGHDVAYFVDSLGADTFFADSEEAAMYGTEYQNEYSSGFYRRAKSFEETQGFARFGGDDVAHLVDSALDDLLEAEADWAKLKYGNSEADFALVEAFAKVHIYADHGGDDNTDVRSPTTFDLIRHGPWDQ